MDITQNSTYPGPFTIALLLCALLFCGTPPSYASQPQSAAIVIAIRGSAHAVDASGLSRQLTIRSPLYEQDRISTGNQGRLQIMFTDNTIVSLGRKASLQISEYTLNKDQTGKLSTTVSEGVFRVMGGILTKTSPQDFSTQTPSGNIGIRGSMYTGQVANGETAVVFEGGKGITFQNKTGFIVISQPGHGTRVKGANSLIPKAHQFKASELQSLQKQLLMRPAQKAGAKPPAPSSFSVPASFSAKTDVAPKEAAKEVQANKETATKDSIEPEHTELETKQEIDELTKQVRDNPAEADRILHDAVTQKGLPVENALEAVFKGMRNPTKDEFDRVKNQALKMGLTIEGATELIKKLKENGGLCK